ncbi:MAG: hypothetical protein LPJ89_07390, partial [Hymenobacteraceae bacterium]|nr:hypothetical protein [Hymenobacteraceae bacterium]
MKKTTFLALGAAALLYACDTSVKSDEATVSEAKEVSDTPEAATIFRIDTTQSRTTWVGSKVTGRHEGTIGIVDGFI